MKLGSKREPCQYKRIASSRGIVARPPVGPVS